MRAAAELQSIVIVGAGQSAAWVARTLRQDGFDRRIVMLGDEGIEPYERPPLSKEALSSGDAPAAQSVFPAAEFSALGIEFHPNDPATAIDRKTKTVRTASGRPIGFDRLVICTGGRARPLPTGVLPTAQMHTLRTLHDARRLGGALRASRHALILGAGWVGLEVAAAARRRGVAVTVIESQPRICMRALPGSLATRLQELHGSAGTEFRLESHVASWETGRSAGVVAVLATGERIETDIVVVAIGMIPNDELARAAGLEVDNGIVVDAHCRTSDPDVFAAGDVTSAPNPWAGGRIRLESWQNAQNQGIAAARAVLGSDAPYAPLPWFWSDQFDSRVEMLGFPLRGSREIVRGSRESGALLCLYTQGERLVAAAGLNCTRDLRAARRIIEQGIPVTDAQLADERIALASLRAPNRAGARPDGAGPASLGEAS